jgi:hypothetical protein
MMAMSRSVDTSAIPENIKIYLGQSFVTPDREYEVHAVVVYNGVVLFQVVDDLGDPNWRPAMLFDVVDASVPDDWICTSFREQPTLLLGPEFVAKDIDAYERMVELEASQVDCFWKRIDSRGS